jgi:PhnB protein
MATKNMQIIPYFMFNGNCEEALNFYRSILGGEIQNLKHYDEPSMNAPTDYKDKILHAHLVFDGAALYASDTFPGKPTHGTSGDISLSLMLGDLDFARKAFAALAEGGRVNFPFDKQFWGDYHGSLTDKYGFNWNVNYGQ